MHTIMPTASSLSRFLAVTTARSIARVEAAARLHLGFLDLGGALGRRFGSIGLSIDPLATIVTATPHACVEVVGDVNERTFEFVETVLAHYRFPAAVHVNVEAVVPPHAGLGSGTQLALATGMAVAQTFDRRIGPKELARVLGRGKRSGLGISLFESGGLVVDGGHGASTSTPPVISRLDFPDVWRVVLILDPTSEGLSGHAESEAFQRLQPMPDMTAAQLCHLTLMGLLPAVAERDFRGFGQHLAAIQTLIGDYFSVVQAGRYTSPAVGLALDHCVHDLNLSGVGQTSWGPTGFAFVESDAEANTVIESLQAKFGAEAGLRFLKCNPRNGGATVADTPDHPARLATG